MANFTLEIPAPDSRYKPKLQSSWVWHLMQDAWEWHLKQIHSEERAKEAAEALTRFVESQYPPAEMAVLAKYGCTRQSDSINVSIYPGEGKAVETFGHEWQRAGLMLTRKVLMPDAPQSFFALRPKYEEEPRYGCTEERWNQMTEEERERTRAYHLKRRDHDTPDELAPFFRMVLEERRNQKHDETMRLGISKDANGKYPTWREIAAQSVVLNAYLTKHWNEGLRFSTPEDMKAAA